MTRPRSFYRSNEKTLPARRKCFCAVYRHHKLNKSATIVSFCESVVDLEKKISL